MRFQKLRVALHLVDITDSNKPLLIDGWELDIENSFDVEESTIEEIGQAIRREVIADD